MNSLSRIDAYRLIRSHLIACKPDAGARLPRSGPIPPVHLSTDLGLDSLDKVQAGTSLMHQLDLMSRGPSYYLLQDEWLAEWIDKCRSSLPKDIHFVSSGSQGKPQSYPHQMRDLLWESAYWAQIFFSARRIICWVPVHHIYGFIFGILLPKTLGVPVRDLPPGTLPEDTDDGDMIVGMPLGWNIWAKTSPNDAPTCKAISSTAPFAPGDRASLQERGVQLYEIYGSSETAGIGWRGPAQAYYQLMSPWQKENSRLWHPHKGHQTPPDHLNWDGDIRFIPTGRLDKVVQVGGHNVSLLRIQQKLETHPYIAHCAVRLDTSLSPCRLKAFIVPAAHAPGLTQLETEILAWSSQQFRSHERPVRLSFGTSLPQSTAGKLADWSPTLA